MSLKHIEKIAIVINYLYRNKGKSASIFEIQIGIKNEVSEFDIDIILEDLVDKGIVLMNPLTDVDGAILPFYNYSISSQGLLAIEEEIFKNKEVSKSKENINETNTDLTKINENPYPIIFKNFYAYQMFIEFKELTLNEKTKVADYSYIYNKMKDKKIKAINPIVTHALFIEFLNDKYDAGIYVEKFQHTNPDKKKATYKFILAKYQEII